MARKDIKRLVEKLKEQNWRVDDRGEQIVAFSPDGRTIVTFHKSESDHRAMKNTISRLRKGGFDPDA